MKQQKNRAKPRASKRVRRRRLSTQSQSSKSKAHGIEVEKQVEIIAKAIVDATVESFTRDQFPKDVPYWDHEELWLQYLGRSVEVLEQHFRSFKAISVEEILESWRELLKEYPECEGFPIESFTEQLITRVRDTFRKELYFTRVEMDAEQLRMVIREEVASLCAQSGFQGHDFICLPPPLPQDDVPDLREEERAVIPQIYCRRIWWMMADDYPQDCRIHFYLECPEGWFSAEVYTDEEEAEQEVQRRKQRGEGVFEIREITEGDDWVVFTVLFSRQRPQFVS